MGYKFNSIQASFKISIKTYIHITYNKSRSPAQRNSPCFRISSKLSTVNFCMQFYSAKHFKCFCKHFKCFCKQCKFDQLRCSKQIILKYRRLVTFSAKKWLSSVGSKLSAVVNFFKRAEIWFFPKLIATSNIKSLV